MDRRGFLAMLPALAGCSSLSAFDALAPKDRGARRVVRDASYGEASRQKLDLYAPSSAGSATTPCFVFFYGGSWSSGSKNDYTFLGRALAAQGFLTMLPDYRLTPEVAFPTFLEDCARAVRWLADHAGAHGGDPRRIVLAGHSAGAYNAIMLALDDRYLRTVGVDLAHIRGAIGLAGPYDFYPFDVDATRTAFGGAPDPQQTQPVRFARADAPPLWLAWGERDETVGPRNIDALAGAMRDAGGSATAQRYPNLNHVSILLALSQPFRGRAPVLADMMAFARQASG